MNAVIQMRSTHSPSRLVFLLGTAANVSTYAVPEVISFNQDIIFHAPFFGLSGRSQSHGMSKAVFIIAGDAE